MSLKIAERKKDGRLLQVLAAKGRQFRVRTLNGTRSELVNKTSVRMLPKPERGVQLRMAKEVNFDQECGCTAIVEIRNGRISTFNVYGDIDKYVGSKVRRGNLDTPHRRRVFLKEHGFVRSRGMTHETDREKQLRKIRKFERTGYKVLV